MHSQQQFAWQSVQEYASQWRRCGSHPQRHGRASARGLPQQVYSPWQQAYSRASRVSNRMPKRSDHERAVARQEREQPPRQRQREEPVTFAIAAGPGLEHMPRVRELVADVEQRPAVAHVTLRRFVGGGAAARRRLPGRCSSG